jgi:hypothetical protein
MKVRISMQMQIHGGNADEAYDWNGVYRRVHERVGDFNPRAMNYNPQITVIPEQSSSRRPTMARVDVEFDA